MQNIIAFKTLDESGFLEFGMLNAKYLTFDTLDGNALIFQPKNNRVRKKKKKRIKDQERL